METEFYICEFCQSKFKPNRRKVQRFCSSTCRVKNHQHKNSIDKPNVSITNIATVETELIETSILKPKKNKVEKISAAGIGNAAAGSLVADGVKAIAKNIFGLTHNDPATKGDIQELKNLLNKRYFKIQNMEPRWEDGAIPYFDITTSSVVYFPNQNYRNPANHIL